MLEAKPMTDPLFDLGGRVALVTGGSRGIGAAIARLLAAHGAHVVVSSRHQEACEAVAASIRDAGGEASAIAAHMGQVDAIEALFAAMDERGLVPHVLVNNAATNPYFGPMLDMDLAAYGKTLDVNVRGYFLATQLAARRMRDAGSGCIVNVASVNGRRAAPGQGVYSFTKAAIINMTEGWARELAAHGIRVNAVLPGLTETHFAGALLQDPKMRQELLHMIPLGRAAQPEEIAPLVLFLAAPAAGYVTGASFTADGGYLS